jgi:hypothetical protein
MQQKLRELRTANNPFWIELNSPNPRNPHSTTGDNVVEDIMLNPDNDEDLDDSDVSLQDVITATHQDLPAPKRCGRCKVSAQENSGLMTTTDVEDINQMLPVSIEVKEEGRGKRKKTANMLYCLGDFKRHWDNEASDIE